MDEHQALADRFEANRTHLQTVAHRMLGSVSEADDAVQEAWLRLSRCDMGGVENLRAWLTTVVARVCLDMLRSRTSRREEPFGVHVPESIVRGERAAEVRAAIEKLPPKQKATLVLRVYQELSHEEIAHVLGSTVGAVKANFFHALGNLRRLLQSS